MEDFFKDLKFHVYDRLKSPLISSFAVSWISWNITTIILLFGKGDFDKKIYMIGRIYEHFYSYFIYGIVLPFLSALLFIFIYPLIARHVFIYWTKQLKITKSTQVVIEDEIPVTQEEFKSLKQSHYGAIRILEVEVDRLQTINKVLKEREKELESELSNILEKEKDKSVRLTELQASLDSLKIEVSQKEKRIVEQEKIIEEHQKINIEMLRDNLDKIDKGASIDKFILDLDINTEGLPRGYYDYLDALKRFQELNKLRIDELKAITYLLSEEGQSTRTSLKAFLNLTSINFDVIMKKLITSDLFASTGETVYLSSKGKEKVYDANLTNVNNDVLKEIVKRLKEK